MAAGVLHLRGSARAHEAPRCDLAGLHAEEDGRARASGAGVLRPQPRSARRQRRIRFREGLRRARADAGHRHAARHPGERPVGDPRLRRREHRPTTASRSRSSVAKFEGEMFAEYIDWRVEHPSDDLMTELLNVEFEDENGTDASAHARGSADVRDAARRAPATRRRRS